MVINRDRLFERMLNIRKDLVILNDLYEKFNEYNNPFSDYDLNRFSTKIVDKYIEKQIERLEKEEIDICKKLKLIK